MVKWMWGMSVENNKVVIKSQDYGIGIPKEDVKKGYGTVL